MTPHAAPTQITPAHVTPASLIDEVMDLFARGERALFADLAQAAWQPHATLASLTSSRPIAHAASNRRDAA